MTALAEPLEIRGIPLCPTKNSDDLLLTSDRGHGVHGARAHTPGLIVQPVVIGGSRDDDVSVIKPRSVAGRGVEQLRCCYVQ